MSIRFILPDYPEAKGINSQYLESLHALYVFYRISGDIKIILNPIVSIETITVKNFKPIP